MTCRIFLAAGLALLTLSTTNASAQAATQPDTAYDPVRELVGRLDLQRYKATIAGLAKFGDRRQGTKRNRDAIDWIEAQLKSYGCQNIERITYQYNPAPPAQRGGGAGRGGAGRGNASPNGRGRDRSHAVRCVLKNSTLSARARSASGWL